MLLALGCGSLAQCSLQEVTYPLNVSQTLTVSVAEAGGMTLLSEVIKVHPPGTSSVGLLQSCVEQSFLFQTPISARCP